MLPVEILISEHRLIERMVTVVKKQIEKINETGDLDLNFLDTTIDFFRTYADRYHHGKEEGILFKSLSSKQLSNIDNTLMHELIMEHALARRTVTSLQLFKENYSGESEKRKNILQSLNTIAELYPRHIEKEDKQFFYPAMKYFSQQEQEEMLNSFLEFDKNFTNKRFTQVLDALEDAFKTEKVSLSKKNTQVA